MMELYFDMPWQNPAKLFLYQFQLKLNAYRFSVPENIHVSYYYKLVMLHVVHCVALHGVNATRAADCSVAQ